MKAASPIQTLLETRGGVFKERDGVAVPAAFSDPADEYRWIRETVGLTDMSFIQMFHSREEDIIYVLDEILAANIANIRYGRIINTFLSDEQGHLLSDVFVANDDEDIYIICENCAPRETIAGCLSPAKNLMRSLNDTHALFALDGPLSWSVMKALFSADILGLPYLSVEAHELDSIPVTVFRAGKTGEFGYFILVEAAHAETVWERLETLVSDLGGGVCGMDIHDTLRLDGRFFNINREGRYFRDPLPLGLQWMIDFRKDTFLGQEAILERRSRGLAKKMVGLTVETEGTPLAVGSVVMDDGQPVGEVINTAYSYTLCKQMALAVLDSNRAYAWLPFTVRTDTGDIPVKTVSMPPFIPKSLTIKLDEI